MDPVSRRCHNEHRDRDQRRELLGEEREGDEDAGPDQFYGEHRPERRVPDPWRTGPADGNSRRRTSRPVAGSPRRRALRAPSRTVLVLMPATEPRSRSGGQPRRCRRSVARPATRGCGLTTWRPLCAPCRMSGPGQRPRERRRARHQPPGETSRDHWVEGGDGEGVAGEGAGELPVGDGPGGAGREFRVNFVGPPTSWTMPTKSAVEANQPRAHQMPESGRSSHESHAGA